MYHLEAINFITAACVLTIAVVHIPSNNTVTFRFFSARVVI